MAGLTTAVMLVPQAMAYAMLAGLPPVVGLYASIVPVIVYSLLGTSRELAVGPVAMVSLLVATGVGALAPPSSEAFITYAVALSAMVGGIQLLMGVGRLGFLTNFLSHPVLSGFTSAAAIIIGLSQLKHLLGVELSRHKQVHRLLVDAVQNIDQVHPVTLAIGLGGIALVLMVRRIDKRLPSALLLVVGSTLLVWGLALNLHGVKIVGTVPAGLPGFSWPQLDLQTASELLPIALTISLVGFMESIAVAKAFAQKRRYEVRANQDLIALGAANLGGSLFGAYPTTGGFSRTAVNAQAGAQTPVASLVTALVVVATVLFLTPLFHYLPKAALAAIIMTAVFGLVDLREVKHLWKVKKSDLALLGITFFVTLTLGIEEGILAGVGASLLWFVVRTTRPHFAVLGRLPGTTVWRNVKRHPQAERVPGVLVIRMDAQFYFGNMSFLRDTLKRLEGELAEPLSHLVIDGNTINHLDSSADAALHDVVGDYTARGVTVWVAGAKGPVLDVMKRSSLYEKVGPEHFSWDVEQAVAAATGSSS